MDCLSKTNYAYFWKYLLFKKMKNADIKILLVDDEPDILEIVGYNLKNEGYQIFTAKNGIEAIKIANKTIPHLIILDIMMPEMDGIEACEKIRATKRLENVLVTFFTARGEDYSQVAGFNVGADDYITKPIKPKVLISKIRALLRRVKTANEFSDSKNGDQITAGDNLSPFRLRLFSKLSPCSNHNQSRGLSGFSFGLLR